MPQQTPSFAIVPVAALAGGSWIFLAFTILFLFAVIYGLYTRRGSGISQRPYGSVYGDSPGALGESRMSGRTDAETIRTYSRGTR